MNALICRMRACRRVSGRTDDSHPSCSQRAAANRSSTALESSNVGTIWSLRSSSASFTKNGETRAADTAAARDAAGYDVGQVVRSHVQQLAGEHDDEHPELAVEAELIGAARVVEREIAWRQRCLAAILRDQAVATELDAEFEVARIESPDGLSGAIDVDGAACDIAELHGTDGAVAQDPAEWTFGPAPCVERYEGLGHCFVPRVELFGWRQRAKRRDGVHRITSAVRSVTVNILAAQHVAPWHRYDDLPERAVGVASSAGHTVASASYPGSRSMACSCRRR